MAFFNLRKKEKVSTGKEKSKAIPFDIETWKYKRFHGEILDIDTIVACIDALARNLAKMRLQAIRRTQDKISITVIVTGIRMSILPSHDPENIITIEEDFVYSGVSGRDGIELQEIRNEKIGYNSAASRKKDLFADGTKPALLTVDGQDISELEHVAAIRRKSPIGSKRN